ncbi:DUF5658 family protein [Chloroflexota bacterium]
MKVPMNNKLSNFSRDIIRTKIKLLLGVLFALVVADGVVSHYLVAQSFGIEWNPIARILLGEGNLFIITKILGALLASLFLWRIHKKHPKLATVTTIGAVVIYTGVIYWNLLVYLMVSL